MSIGQQWAIVFIVLWIGSCWYFYSIGKLHGTTEANLKSAKVLQDLARGAKLSTHGLTGLEQ
jgi:hypothetical protein